jgi:hypothetical protein
VVHIPAIAMKKHILYSGAIVFAALTLAAALVWARHPVPSRANGGAQLQELRNRISQLESKAAALEKELGEVRKKPQPTPTVIYTPANEVIPSVTTSPTPEQIPPGWKPFGFNGITYYFTPLGQGMKTTIADARQSEIGSLESFQHAK